MAATLTPSSTGSPACSASPLAAPLAHTVDVLTTEGGRPSRVDYLDRLKSCLTVLVVVHHCTCNDLLQPIGYLRN